MRCGRIRHARPVRGAVGPATLQAHACLRVAGPAAARTVRGVPGTECAWYVPLGWGRGGVPAAAGAQAPKNGAIRRGVALRACSRPRRQRRCIHTLARPPGARRGGCGWHDVDRGCRGQGSHPRPWQRLRMGARCTITTLLDARVPSWAYWHVGSRLVLGPLLVLHRRCHSDQLRLPCRVHAVRCDMRGRRLPSLFTHHDFLDIALADEALARAACSAGAPELRSAAARWSSDGALIPSQLRCNL